MRVFVLVVVTLVQEVQNMVHDVKLIRIKLDDARFCLLLRVRDSSTINVLILLHTKKGPSQLALKKSDWGQTTLRCATQVLSLHVNFKSAY